MKSESGSTERPKANHHGLYRVPTKRSAIQAFPLRLAATVGVMAAS